MNVQNVTETVRAALLQRAILCMAEAQVGIAMEPRGALTELGESRRNDHAPSVFTCPPHAAPVDILYLWRCWRVALRCWGVHNENHGKLKQEFNFKYMLKLLCIGFRRCQVGGRKGFTIELVFTIELGSQSNVQYKHVTRCRLQLFDFNFKVFFPATKRLKKQARPVPWAV